MDLMDETPVKKEQVQKWTAKDAHCPKSITMCLQVDLLPYKLNSCHFSFATLSSL